MSAILDSLTAALQRLDTAIGLLDRALTKRLERLGNTASSPPDWEAERRRLEAELAAARHGERQAQEQARIARMHLDTAIASLQNGAFKEG